MQKKPSLYFVEAVNFELTYQCNLSCSHCLQQEIRQQGSLPWINTDSAISALVGAHDLGFTRSGVNFTGGEPFLGESNLPELLEAARHLGVNIRVNTNGWWGGKEEVAIGSKNFSDCKAVVKWLKQQDVTVLALSLDQRYDNNEHLLNSVLNVIQECEESGLYYQLVHTRSASSENILMWYKLAQKRNIRFDYMIPVEMEMVDLGAASSLEGISTSSHMYCEGKGFYRPQYLHINPDGGVRTCMYASGAGWLGNINKQSLSEIAYQFANNPVVKTFSSNCVSKSNFVEEIYSGKDVLKHPCALTVKIAEAVEVGSQNNVQ